MAMTRASRNVGLRTFYDPLNPPDAKPTKSYPPRGPFGRSGPSGYEPGGSGPAPFGYGGGSPTAIESNASPSPAYEPSGGETPYDPLSSIRAPAAPAPYEPGGGVMPPYDPLSSIRTPTVPIYEPGGAVENPGAAGYAMPPWSPPSPPPRPGGLGGVLSKAVVPATAARAAPAAAVAPAAPAAAPQSSMFTGIDRQNSGPNDRFRGGGTALNLSGLLGGLFGGGGAAPSPAPPPPPARGTVSAGRQAPDMSGITFDQNGNPVSGYELGPGISPQNPTQLAATAQKPGWWKALR